MLLVDLAASKLHQVQIAITQNKKAAKRMTVDSEVIRIMGFCWSSYLTSARLRNSYETSLLVLEVAIALILKFSKDPKGCVPIG